jgi:hypothetical protein
MRIATTTALLVLLLPCVAFGQETACPDDMKIMTCYNQIVGTTLRAAEEKEETKEVAAETTGVPAIEADAGNSLRDFLSFFAAAVQTATLSEKDDAITLDWNLRFSEAGEDPIKLQAVLRKPTLWKAFAETVSDAAVRDNLLEDLDDTDDITLSVSYGPENENLGRNLPPHRTLFNAVTAPVAALRPSDAEDELDKLLQTAGFDDDVADAEDLTFNDAPAARREDLRKATLKAARQAKADREAFVADFAKRGFERFSDLLNNQPQLYVSASRRERNSLVGPRETSLKLTYEKGFVNLNTFKKAAGGVCPDDSDACSAAFTTYVQRSDVIQGLDAANRVSLSIEYADVGEYDIKNALLPDPFHVEGSRKTNGSFTYGRVLRRDEQKRDGRVDVSLTYEDVKGDPNLDNRWIGSAIYTQKLSDTVSIPIGFVWASHEKDVPDSDERVSAHLGLIFKLPKLVP